MSYIGNQITGFLGTGSLTVTTSTVAVEGDSLFSADGNVVLGDASGDTITINAATASIPNNLNIDSNTLFLDAANNRIGIGTSSPSRQLHVSGSGVNTRLRVENTTGSNVFDVYAEDSGNSTLNYSSVLTMSESGTERMRIDSSGNVLVSKTSSNTNTVGVEARNNGQLIATLDGGTALIANRKTSDGDVVKIMKDGSTVGVIGTQNWGVGTSSPLAILDVKNATNEHIIVSGASAYGNNAIVGVNDGGGEVGLGLGGSQIEFYTGATERMRIDSSGKLLVGTTSDDPRNFSGGTYGSRIDAGQPEFAVATMFINRSATSNGDIISFRKESSTVGSIYTNAADGGSSPELCFASGNTGLKFDDTNNYIRPTNSAGAHRDNIVTLGDDNSRFKDLYLGGNIYLGGTGSANALDDYEEGTWTPGIDGVSYATADGHYIKIGNYVHCIGVLVNASSTVTSANAQFTGLPFTVSSDNLSATSLEGSGFFQYFGNVGVAVSGINLTPFQNTTTCNIYYVPAGGVASGNISIANRQHFDASNVSLRFNITYFTD